MSIPPHIPTAYLVPSASLASSLRQSLSPLFLTRLSKAFLAVELVRCISSSPRCSWAFEKWKSEVGCKGVDRIPSLHFGLRWMGWRENKIEPTSIACMKWVVCQLKGHSRHKHQKMSGIVTEKVSFFANRDICQESGFKNRFFFSTFSIKK